MHHFLEGSAQRFNWIQYIFLSFRLYDGFVTIPRVWHKSFRDIQRLGISCIVFLWSVIVLVRCFRQLQTWPEEACKDLLHPHRWLHDQAPWPSSLLNARFRLTVDRVFCRAREDALEADTACQARILVPITGGRWHVTIQLATCTTRIYQVCSALYKPCTGFLCCLPYVAGFRIFQWTSAVMHHRHFVSRQ